MKSLNREIDLYLLLLCAINLLIIGNNIQNGYLAPILTGIILILALSKKVISPLIPSASYFMLAIGVEFSQGNARITNGSSLGNLLPEYLHIQSLNLFYLASSCMAISVIGFKPTEVQKFTFNLEIFTARRKQFAVFVTINFFLFLFSIDFHSIFFRNSHLVTFRFPVAGRFFSSMVLINIVLLTFLIIKNKSFYRYFYIAMYLLHFLMQYALSSRAMVIFPLTGFLVIPLVKSKFQKLFLGILSISISLLMNSLALALRGQVNQGLVNYLQINPFRNLPITDSLNNLITSYDINGLSAFYVSSFPITDLLIELNPLPGNIAGWYEIADRHRINLYTPTATLGELQNFGTGILILYMLVVGFTLRLAESKIDFSNQIGQLKRTILYVGTTLFTLQSLQYSIRSSLRMLLYTFLLMSLISVFSNGVLSLGRKG